MEEKTIRRNDLPLGWEQIHLKDVCEIILGQSPPSETYNTIREGLPFFQGKAEFTELYPIVEKWCSKPKKIAEQNDILLSVRAPVGNTNIADKKCCIGQGLAALRFKNHKFLFYYLRSIEKELDKKGTGTTFKAISGDIVRNVDFLLPPLHEQNRIVAKIEELFSERDKGVEALKTAQQQLKVYRQAVLKWAFEGKLTEELRMKNPSEKANILIEKIQKQKNRLLNERIANGDNEAKRLKSKILKHTFIKPSKTLPKGWSWTSFMESCLLVVDCHNKTAPYENKGIHLVRTSNIRNGKLILNEDIRYVSEATDKYWSRRCPPTPGDILFTREAPMGEAAIIPEKTTICMGQRIMLLRIVPDLLIPKYLLYSIMDSVFQNRTMNSAIGTGVKHLRVGDVEALAFPICSTKEQNQIVQQIETRLSVADKLAETITQSLQQAEALRQSIFKKAFAGKLVPQDPNDEPASKLLERIKEEKAAQTPIQQTRKKKAIL